MPVTFAGLLTVALENQAEKMVMNDFQFSLIIPASTMTQDEILDATDALGNAGCTDASIRGHAEGIELLFERTAESLQAAIASAISDVERAGYRVARAEMEREAISV
ncbi:MAG: hypothetical protein HYV26_01315 [Candidatus Hydrogenedentes bacterium]|nr:hypothetical protein [Candidatus Hydrogenedentota bacterium]